MRTKFLNTQRSHTIAENGLACSSHPLSSAAALRAFNIGGNALDAALTAVIVQGVVDPGMTGIGGDCFCLIGQDREQVRAFNGSGRTPAKASISDLGGEIISAQEPAAITVPGAVEAWAKLHKEYGKLEWSQLFEDAIKLASEGFPVHERVAHDWGQETANLANSETARDQFLNRKLKSPTAGQRWRLPKLSRSLTSIANQGIEPFYRGELARAMVSYCAKIGGKHQLSDFSEHTGEWVSPIYTSYSGLDIFECPPNGQGLVALIAFAVLEEARGYGWLGSSDPLDPDRVEWQLRALSAGYEVRDKLISDPSETIGLVEACLAKPHISNLAKELMEQKKKRTPLYKSPLTTPHRDTVYVAARDKSGLSVSIINSIFNSFGSTHVVPDTGILLHSRGSSFSTDQAHPNAYGPSKRPMHTIMPSLAIRDGKVETIFGVMGAHYQPQGQVHVMTAMQDCGLSPQAAQELPRWFANPDGYVEVESTVPAQLVKELEHRLGSVHITEEPLGGSQIIKMENGFMIGGTDPRKDGLAIGY